MASSLSSCRRVGSGNWAGGGSPSERAWLDSRDAQTSGAAGHLDRENPAAESGVQTGAPGLCIDVGTTVATICSRFTRSDSRLARSHRSVWPRPLECSDSPPGLRRADGLSGPYCLPPTTVDELLSANVPSTQTQVRRPGRRLGHQRGGRPGRGWVQDVAVRSAAAVRMSGPHQGAFSPATTCLVSTAIKAGVTAWVGSWAAIGSARFGRRVRHGCGAERAHQRPLG